MKKHEKQAFLKKLGFPMTHPMVMFRQWVSQFSRKYLVCALDEKAMSELTRDLFYVRWQDCNKKLSFDIEGGIVNSIEKTSDIIGSHISTNPLYGEGTRGMMRIDPRHEDLTIALEMLKYWGKDVNVMEMFTMFKEIHIKLLDQPQFADAMKAESWEEKWNETLRENFIQALAHLKMLGFLSNTSASTFIFRKNVFGKPYKTQAKNKSGSKNKEE